MVSYRNAIRRHNTEDLDLYFLHFVDFKDSVRTVKYDKNLYILGKYTNQSCDFNINI